MASCDTGANELQPGRNLPLEVLLASPAGTMKGLATPSQALSLPPGSFLIAKITAMS